MRLLDYGQNKHYMDELKRNITNVVPFLGAGVSMPYGYPSWSGLVLKVLTSIHDVCDMTVSTCQKIKDLISEGHYMSATEEMYKCWPNLENYVYKETSMITPINGSCLEKYIHLFPSGIYLTTNYDEVVENFLQRYFRNLNVVIATSSIPKVGLISRTETMLYYLHGKYNNPDSIVFSNADYNYFYGPEKIADIKSIRRQFLARKLQEIYLKDPLLFIGCSMNMDEDRILRLLKKFNLMGQQPDNFSYALLEAPKGSNQEARLLSRERELLAIKVYPIWYFPVNENDHEQAKNELFEYILGESRNEFEVKFKKQQEEYEIERKKQKEKEEELKKLIKEIEESSEIKERFQYSQKYYSTGDDYEFVLIMVNNQYYLSDQGRTYKMLDNVFELKQPDVIKNLKAIVKECGVLFEEKLLVIPLKSWNDLPEEKQGQLLEEAKCKLFTCVSLMDTMRIFYV